MGLQFHPLIDQTLERAIGAALAQITGNPDAETWTYATTENLLEWQKMFFNWAYYPLAPILLNYQMRREPDLDWHPPSPTPRLGQLE